MMVWCLPNVFSRRTEMNGINYIMILYMLVVCIYVHEQNRQVFGYDGSLIDKKMLNSRLGKTGLFSSNSFSAEIFHQNAHKYTDDAMIFNTFCNIIRCGSVGGVHMCYSRERHQCDCSTGYIQTGHIVVNTELSLGL